MHLCASAKFLHALGFPNHHLGEKRQVIANTDEYTIDTQYDRWQFYIVGNKDTLVIVDWVKWVVSVTVKGFVTVIQKSTHDETWSRHLNPAETVFNFLDGFNISANI